MATTDEKFSFMNTYHKGKDLKYVSELAGWNEHVHSSDLYEAGENSGMLFSPITNKKEKRGAFKEEDLEMHDEDYENMLHDTTLSSPEDMLHNRFNKFSRYGYLDPAHELVTGNREYLFFSKPDLHLVDTSNPADMYDKLKVFPFFKEAFSRYKLSYYSLQQYFGTSTGVLESKGLNIDLSNKYINLLSNMVTSSFDLPDITATDVLNNQNLYQTNTSYREGSISSDLQYDFSLEFKDTKYLDVYMLFKIYDEYFRSKYMTEIMPTRYSYIINKIYPEALSIWKIIVDDTGRIMYWAKATGCTPMSVPRGTISNIENTIKFTINWKAQFIRDMDPINLTELNWLTARSLGFSGPGRLMHNFLSNRTISPLMDGKTWVGYPYVMSTTGSSLRTGHHTTDTSNNIGFHRLVWIN